MSTGVICEDPLDVVVSHNHPLAEKADVSLKQLAGYAAILPATNTYTRQIAKRAFNRLDLALEVALSTNFLETINRSMMIDSA